MSPYYLVIDCENDNESSLYKRNAGNFMYDKIVAVGYKNGSISKAEYTSDKNLIMGLIPNSIHTLVGHNIKHDLLFLWGVERLKYMIEQGLVIWDTQLAEYYLTSFQNKYASLRDLAVNKYGCKERPKHIERLLFNKQETIDALCELNKEAQEMLTRYDVINKQQLENNISLRNEEILKVKNYKQVSDLPKELVLEDVRNDVSDTETIYLKQVEECKKLGILEVVLLQMEALLSTIEMEYNGFKIDLDRLTSNQKELEIRLEKVKSSFDDLVINYMPLDLFYGQPKKGLELLFFGGVIAQKTKVNRLDINGLPIMIKTGNNKGTPKLVTQVQQYIINGLGLTKQDSWKTDLGNISIGEVMLTTLSKVSTEYDTGIDDGNNQRVLTGGNKIRDCREISKLLLEIRGLEKQISTYYKSMNNLVYECDSCIHARFNHVSTITGRLSSSDPNLQNIPKSKKSKIKEHFISRY